MTLFPLLLLTRLCAEAPFRAYVADIGARSIVSQRAWETVGHHQPDTVYPYSIRRNGEILARGAVRTWPVTAKEIPFFVVGDFGNTSPRCNP